MQSGLGFGMPETTRSPSMRQLERSIDNAGGG